MKILWVNPSFLDYRVPFYRSLNEHADGNFHLVYSKNRVPERCIKKIEQAIGANAHGIADEGTFSLGNRTSDFSCKKLTIPFPKGLRSMLSTIDTDVVIGEGFFQWTPWAIVRAKKTGLPFALAYEKTEYTERNCPRWRRLYRMFINKFVDLYLVNGSLSRQYLRNVIHARQPIIEGVMAADSKNIAELVKQDHEARDKVKGLVYLFVGQLIERKGVDHLIHAWLKHIVENPDDLLYIVGDGPEMPRLKDLAMHEPSIHFEGNIDYDSIHHYYAKADVFVIPTLEDNWSLVVPEAMACGLPIATSIYNGCHPELLKEGMNGVTFDPLNESSLLHALAYFHHKDLTDMGKMSREIEKSYSPEMCANRVFSSLEDLVKNRK